MARKLLALGDTPTVQTGFARVMQNLLRRWRPHFDEIDVWGVNHAGLPDKPSYVDRIYPAAFQHLANWVRPESLERFLNLIMGSNYTHLFIIQDSFNLVMHNLPAAIHKACHAKGVSSMAYIPVDAPLDPEWTDIARAVDHLVAYTEYGAAEFRAKIQARLRALPEGPQELPVEEPPIHILPHGVDTEIYRPLSDRLEIKSRMLEEWSKSGDTILLNVNTNSRRKNPARSLEILAELRRRKLPFRLIMHMPRKGDGLDLESAAAQLGLRLGLDWAHTGYAFYLNYPTRTEPELNCLYNSADCLLTTTLGEGWGFSIVEALAAGLIVAVPNNTSCAEIARVVRAEPDGRHRVITLPLDEGAVTHDLDNSRLRYPTNISRAASLLEAARGQKRFTHNPRSGLPDRLKTAWSWDRIAAEFLKLWGVVKAEDGGRTTEGGGQKTDGAEIANLKSPVS